MSKESGLGRKRTASKLNKGMDKCDAASHGKQCGKIREVSKGEHLKTKGKTSKNRFCSKYDYIY